MAQESSRITVLDSLQQHLWNLRSTGYYYVDPRENSRTGIQLQKLYMGCIAMAVWVHNLQEGIYAYQVCDNLELLVAASFLFLTHVVTNFKQLVFYTQSRRLDQLFDMLDGPIFNRQNPAHNRLLLATARAAHRLVLAYTGAAIATCLLWAVFPLLDRRVGREVILPLWFPFEIKASPMFELALLYVTMHNILQGYANTTMDAVISTLLAQAKTQFSILRYDLEKMASVARDRSRYFVKYEDLRTRREGGGDRETDVNDVINGTDFQRNLFLEFVKCVIHHRTIVDFLAEIQSLFGTVIFVQFTVGGWIICMTAYKITDLEPLSIQFVSMLLYMSCILTELFLYCYYGNEVAIESDRLAEALYLSDWLACEPALRRCALTFMERSKMATVPTAGRIIPLNMYTFVQLIPPRYRVAAGSELIDEILKSSYTCYAVLKRTKDHQ